MLVSSLAISFAQQWASVASFSITNFRKYNYRFRKGRRKFKVRILFHRKTQSQSQIQRKFLSVDMKNDFNSGDWNGMLGKWKCKFQSFLAFLNFFMNFVYIFMLTAVLRRTFLQRKFFFKFWERLDDFGLLWMLKPMLYFSNPLKLTQKCPYLQHLRRS